MSLVAHLSDLHFGRVDDAVVEGVLEDVARANPRLVVVSGDLTQRARRAEFRAARDFLARIAAPVLCVPGNHDIPLYDVARRFLRPLRRYQDAVSQDLCPTWHDDELAVLGLNTARSFTWKDGALSAEQAARVRAWGREVPAGAFRVLVTHHPFLPPEASPHERIVAGADAALRAAQDAGVELLLAGHLHLGYTRDARAHHVTLERSILVAQAGTATSTRRRGEVNAYNLIDIDGRAAPVNVPDVIPDIDLTKSVTDAADFSGKGAVGGVARGVEGGTGPVNTDQPYFEFQVEKPVVSAGGCSPRYPDILKSANVEGEVLAQFVVDADGKVEVGTFKPLKSSHELFTSAVKSCLPSMKFLAAEVGGRKVKQLVQQPFQFALQK